MFFLRSWSPEFDLIGQHGKKHKGNGVLASLSLNNCRINFTTQISCWVFRTWIQFAMNRSSKLSEEMLNLIGMCLAKVNEKLIIATWMQTSDGDTCKSMLLSGITQQSRFKHDFVHDFRWLFDLQRGVKYAHEESLDVYYNPEDVHYHEWRFDLHKW